jgi:Zn-dependent protease with chaperone function
MLAGVFGLTIYPLKWFGVIFEGDYGINRLVDDVSRQMQIPIAAVFILPSYLCNAWAVFYARQVIFSDKLLSVLSHEQIKAVCAHELAHVNDRNKGLPVRIALACALASAVFIKPVLALEENAEQIALTLVVYGAFLLVWMGLAIWAGRRIARGMEERADRAAVAHQRDAGAYAGALARVYEINLMPAVMSRRSGDAHPDLYDRMLVAGITPEFPRPLPPKRRAGVVVDVLAVGLVATTVVVVLLDR